MLLVNFVLLCLIDEFHHAWMQLLHYFSSYFLRVVFQNLSGASFHSFMQVLHLDVR